MVVAIEPLLIPAWKAPPSSPATRRSGSAVELVSWSWQEFSVLLKATQGSAGVLLLPLLLKGRVSLATAQESRHCAICLLCLCFFACFSSLLPFQKCCCFYSNGNFKNKVKPLVPPGPPRQGRVKGRMMLMTFLHMTCQSTCSLWLLHLNDFNEQSTAATRRAVKPAADVDNCDRKTATREMLLPFRHGPNYCSLYGVGSTQHIFAGTYIFLWMYGWNSGGSQRKQWPCYRFSIWVFWISSRSNGGSPLNQAAGERPEIIAIMTYVNYKHSRKNLECNNTGIKTWGSMFPRMFLGQKLHNVVKERTHLYSFIPVLPSSFRSSFSCCFPLERIHPAAGAGCHLPKQ